MWTSDAPRSVYIPRRAPAWPAAMFVLRLCDQCQSYPRESPKVCILGVSEGGESLEQGLRTTSWRLEAAGAPKSTGLGLTRIDGATRSLFSSTRVWRFVAVIFRCSLTRVFALHFASGSMCLVFFCSTKLVFDGVLCVEGDKPVVYKSLQQMSRCPVKRVGPCGQYIFIYRDSSTINVQRVLWWATLRTFMAMFSCELWNFILFQFVS